MMKLTSEAEAATWHQSDPDWLATYIRDYADHEAALQRACARHDIDVAAASGVTL